MEKDFGTELEDLIFQLEMIAGMSYVLWDSLVKSDLYEGENNYMRSLAAYAQYEKLERLVDRFRNQLDWFLDSKREE